MTNVGGRQHYSAQSSHQVSSRKFLFPQLGSYQKSNLRSYGKDKKAGRFFIKEVIRIPYLPRSQSTTWARGNSFISDTETTGAKAFTGTDGATSPIVL